MKKYWLRVVSLALALTLIFSLGIVAGADTINLGVQIQNGTDRITVTLDNSEGSNKILARENPTLTVACGFDYAFVMYGSDVVSSTLADGKITFSVNQGGTYVVYRGSEDVEVSVGTENELLPPGSWIEIDGIPHQIDSEGKVAMFAGSKSIVSFTYHEDTDPHKRYPTGMYVWELVEENGVQTLARVEELDNILQYSGSSIRVTGQNGIRMITSMEQVKKRSLTSSGLAGYTLEEYGTVLSWADQISQETPLVLGRSYAKSNYAYKKGKADPVFAYDRNLVQYTNVLVGFDMDQCSDDIAMRPYMILKDETGRQVTLYGGTVYRSIGYIAYQNHAVFTPGSAAYDYVWEIIHHVYGDQYDAEYKG